MNSSNMCPSTSKHMSNIRLSQHGKQQLNGYRPNVVMAENQKKSYNYMASPNYLQYENTYQKYKNICHNKDVTNFRESNLNHDQRMVEYRNHDDVGFTPNDRYGDVEVKAENTMQSSDDEGGFRQNMHYPKNQFNHLNGVNACNGANGNMGYNFKEMEPLLHGGHINSRQKYEPPHYANPAAMVPMQNTQKSTESQMSNHCHNNRFHNHHHHHHQQQQQQQKQQFQHGNSPYRKVPPIPSMQPYTKPLPKLPTNIGRTSFNSIFFFYTEFNHIKRITLLICAHLYI